MTALVFAFVISLFVAGVATVSVSHLNRSSTESDYATAIQLADAGINYELRWLSQDSTNFASAHQAYPKGSMPGPYTGTDASIPGGGSFTVSVMNADGSGPWAPPNELLIRSTGTVNGVSRTIEITGQKRSLFDDYAIFSIVEGELNGTGSLVIGNMGTNGPVTFNGGASTSNIQGELTYNGYPSANPLNAITGYVPANNVWWNPDPVPWPTVEEIAATLFPGGMSYLRNGNHDNAKAREFDITDPNYTIALSKIRAVPLEVSNSVLNSYTADGNVNDVPPDGRYHDGVYPLYRRRVLILPPGDYYFNRLNITNPNNYGILIDNAAGMVRIWVDDEGNNQSDTLSTVVAFTSTDIKHNFRLYYNKCSTLSISATFYGSVYTHRDGCSSGLPEVKLGGNSGDTAVIYGSVIGNNIKIHGNSRINHPNNGGGVANDDWALWYGFKNTYREINPNGGPVFSDGTSR